DRDEYPRGAADRLPGVRRRQLRQARSGVDGPSRASTVGRAGHGASRRSAERRPSEGHCPVKTTLAWVAGYGPPVLFAWVMVDQAGIPLPAIPLLLAVGALVGAGKMNLLVALGTALAGCLAADLIWYGFGRRRGAPVLGSLRRITLEADTGVRRVGGPFTRYRLGTLFMAKFLPGLNPIAAALSGVVKVRIDRFIGIELAGALVWAAGWMSVGYAFSDLIDRVTDQVSRMGGLSILLIVG